MERLSKTNDSYESERSAVGRYEDINPTRHAIRWPGNHHLIRLIEIPQGKEDEINRKTIISLPAEITDKYIEGTIWFSHLVRRSTVGLPAEEFLVLTGVPKEV